MTPQGLAFYPNFKKKEKHIPNSKNKTMLFDVAFNIFKIKMTCNLKIKMPIRVL